ncbi:MAG: hypothetical protein ACI9CB_000555 [Rhodothermales bacterium]|jgi:hypothetical protein
MNGFTSAVHGAINYSCHSCPGLLPAPPALYAIIEAHYPRFLEAVEYSNGHLPAFVRQEFEDYLKCGLLEHGFLRVKCDGCRHEHLVAFSWPLLRIPAPAALVNPFTSPRRGFCPSCGARRMVESAARRLDRHRGARAAGAGERNVATDVMTGGG